MRKFRLKSEAIPFFDEKFHNKVADFNFWDENGISKNAIYEVGKCYVNLGIKRNDVRTDISGWREGESHYHFTVYVEHSYAEHDKFKSEHIHGLLHSIEITANEYLKETLITNHK